MRTFYVRRVARLLPGLLVVAVAFTPVAFGLHLATPGWIAAGVLSTLGYVANFLAAFGNAAAVRHTYLWAWTLSLEEQFYLVWPIVLIFALRRGRWSWLMVGTLCVCAVSETLRVMLPMTAGQASARVYAAPDTRMDGLAIGCLLALYFARQRPTVSKYQGRALVTLALATISVAYASAAIDSRATYVWWILMVQLAAAALIVVAIAGDATALRGLAWRPVAYVGRISYGLYLWNIPLFETDNPHAAR